MAEDSEHNVDVKKCYCYSFTFGNCTGKILTGKHLEWTNEVEIRLSPRLVQPQGINRYVH